MGARHDSQVQIEAEVRPVAEQVVREEVERLLTLSEQQMSILQDCLRHIDRGIVNC